MLDFISDLHNQVQRNDVNVWKFFNVNTGVAVKICFKVRKAV